MASRRSSSHQDIWSDEAGAFQVLEAIMASLILFGAILFVALSANPVRDVGAPGVQLGSLADDVLAVLENQPGKIDPSVSQLEEIVTLALQGDVEDADRFLDKVIPLGTRYALRLDNGVQPLQLLPASNATLSTPRDASGAVSFYFSNWTTGVSPSLNFTHGDELDFSGWDSLRAPDGSLTGPGGESWLDLWAAFEPGQNTVPSQVPFGVWNCSGTGCTDFRIALEDGTAVDRHLYAVQLLLWDGV